MHLEKDKNNLIERYFVVQYMQALNQIKTVMNRFNVHVRKAIVVFPTVAHNVGGNCAILKENRCTDCR